jgi:DNA-binding NtrC family response regulator
VFPSAGSSVLVIDDDAAARWTFTQLLSHSGVEHVSGASGVDEALELVAARKFDVIVCDYRMDGKDGLKFLEELRSRGDHTPVILVSGAPDKFGVIRAAALKAEFLTKPVRVSELLEAMNRNDK